MRHALIVTAALSLLLAGCGDVYGPNCQSSCTRIWGDGGECQLKKPGQEASDSYDRCVDRCEQALKVPGELDGYDPEERITSGETVDLENEKQAAVWMDCVMETACEDLDAGYCAPI